MCAHVASQLHSCAADRAGSAVDEHALGNRLNGRICDMEIDERSDNAMLSDLAPVFAALNQRSHETQLT